MNYSFFSSLLVLSYTIYLYILPVSHLIIYYFQTGNLGNLLLIVIPAICKEKGSPFGDHGICASVGLSYASFSMAVSSYNRLFFLGLLISRLVTFIFLTKIILLSY